MSGWLRPRSRSFGVPKLRLEDVPSEWVIPELMPMPPEVAVDVVRFARWRLHDYATHRDEEQSGEPS